MSTADEINKLKDLLDQGIISQEDFETQKEKLLKKGQSKLNFEFNRKTKTYLIVGVSIILGVFIFTQTSIGGVSYKGRVRAIDFQGSEYVYSDPSVGCIIDHFGLKIRGDGSDSFTISSDDGERLHTGYFEKGEFEIGFYNDKFGGTPVESGEVACYYTFNVRLPRKDAYIFKNSTGQELTFTKDKVDENGFTITLDLTD